MASVAEEEDAKDECVGYALICSLANYEALKGEKEAPFKVLNA